MNIKNMKLSSVEARRYATAENKPRNVRIDHNSTVTLFTATSKGEARVEFEFTASYGPVGLIKLSGEFSYEANDAREVAERWSDSKDMPNEVAARVHTAIMHFCLPEAVILSRDLRLPPPIPMPQVQFGQPQDKKSNSGWSPEVA